MVTKRTRLSLWQFLFTQPSAQIDVLVEKHGLKDNKEDYSYIGPSEVRGSLKSLLLDATEHQLLSLLEELANTQNYLRNNVDYQMPYEERWSDLLRCLELDGYKIEDGRLVPVDPTILDDPPLEDDLSHEIRRSGLTQADNVLGELESSAQDFRKAVPDYNGCLTHARVGLETLAREIAIARRVSYPGSFDETRWSEVLAYLRTSGLLTPAEEKVLAGVYGFVSAGAHIPIGLSEQEMARLGRSLVASMSYFLVKRYNG